MLIWHWTYGKGPLNKRGNLLLPLHQLLLAARFFFICAIPQTWWYHHLCYTSHGALAGTRNSSMGQPWGIDPMTHRTMSGHCTMKLHLAQCYTEVDYVVFLHECLERMDQNRIMYRFIIDLISLSSYHKYKMKS